MIENLQREGGKGLPKAQQSRKIVQFNGDYLGCAGGWSEAGHREKGGNRGGVQQVSGIARCRGILLPRQRHVGTGLLRQSGDSHLEAARAATAQRSTLEARHQKGGWVAKLVPRASGGARLVSPPPPFEQLGRGLDWGIQRELELVLWPPDGTPHRLEADVGATAILVAQLCGMGRE